MKVHQLPEDLILRIAAGEVIERPASIIKELVENSLDAGATHVAVAVEGAGRTRVTVSDDGCGMSKEDALLALRRHATSKISRLEDLERIHTYGFRGEALPSIASVSRMTITTRERDDDMGWQLEIEGGKVLSEKPVAREPGTTIDIRDIFFNTPARFKFLKSDTTERSQCLRVIEEMVFSSPNVTFQLTLEKAKPVLFRAFSDTSVENLAETVKTRLTEAWGPRWSRSLLPVFHQTDHFRVTGVITNQTAHQATSRYQFLYINKRPVQNRRLTRALYDAYQGQLPSLRHPAWVLFLELDPSTVDVNVHPAKREVKLTHESELYAFMNAAAKASLQGIATVPEKTHSFAPASLPSSSAPAYPTEFRRPPPPSAKEKLAADSVYRPLPPPAPPSRVADPLPGFDAAVEERPELSDLRDPELVVLGQLRKTYIVAKTKNGLLLVDQHAAAEQAAYERLMFDLGARKRSVQPLLIPFTWEVAMSLVPLVQQNVDRLNRMGFLIEPFGGNTFIVKGLPAHLREKFDLHSLLDGLSDEFMSTNRAGDLDHRLAAMTACKASIKAGDPLDNAGSLEVLRLLSVCKSPFTCPHGRPTVVRFPYSELDRKFRR